MNSLYFYSYFRSRKNNIIPDSKWQRRGSKPLKCYVCQTKNIFLKMKRVVYVWLSISSFLAYEYYWQVLFFFFLAVGSDVSSWNVSCSSCSRNGCSEKSTFMGVLANFGACSAWIRRDSLGKEVRWLYCWYFIFTCFDQLNPQVSHVLNLCKKWITNYLLKVLNDKHKSELLPNIFFHYKCHLYKGQNNFQVFGITDIKKNFNIKHWHLVNVI